MSELLVPWELATDDYGYFSVFPPAIRIAEACEDRGLRPRFLFPRDVPAFLAERPTGGPCLIRGMVAPTLIESLENAGFRCVNGARGTRIANDKLETARLAHSLGIPTPETRAAEDGTGALGFPLVVKPRFGSRGRGVKLAENAEAARSYADSLARAGIPAIYQAYVASSRGRDLRAFFAGDRIIALAEREAPGKGLVSNAAKGGTMVASAFPHPREPWERATFDLAGAAGLRYGTADFLFTVGGGLTLCEINAAPGFEALEKACGIDAAGAIVDAVLEGR